jgi:uncharacterized RDD family membrane protein YckC/Tfp pilus assembly major pilin PilA
MQQDDTNAASAEYGNFGLRLVAFLVDRVIIAFICFTLAWLIAKLFSNDSRETVAYAFTMSFLLIFILGPIYYSVLESSAHQATWGKRWLGIKVVDLQGNRLTFMHALGRTLSAAITGLVPLAIGYLMAAFTKRKQAIHDMIASTLVVTAQSPQGVVPADGAKGGSNSGTVIAVILAVGFVLISVIGILAAIAIPQYQDYTVRAKLAGVMATAKSITPKVDQYFIDNQRLPTDIQALGVTLPSAESKHIQSIQINQRTGQIIARLTGLAGVEGKRLILTPSEVGKPDTVWRCHSEEIPAKMLPSACRQKE